MVQFQLKKLLLIVGLLISSLSIYSQGLPRIRFTQIQQDTTFGSVLVSSPTDSNITYSRNFYITSDNILRFYNDTIPIKFYVDSVDATKVNTNLNNVTGVLPVANGGTGATTLTANKVLVGNGTSTILQPTNLHWDNTNSYLGVGTDSPNSFLTIKTNEAASGINIWGRSDDYAVLRFSNNDGSTTNGVIYTTGSSYLGFDAGSAGEDMQIDSNGNVGIGTSSPNSLLTLKTPGGTITPRNMINIVNNNAGSGDDVKINFTASDGTSSLGYIQNSYNGAITTQWTTAIYGLSAVQLGTGTCCGATPLAIMTLRDNGNVGIGTTNPNDKLEVNGGIVLGYDHALRFRNSSNQVDQILAYNNSTYLDARGGDIIFRVNPSTITERMRIRSDGKVFIYSYGDQGAYNLQVAGTGVWGQGAYVNGSDIKMKENILQINNALNKVLNLNPVMYNYKPEYTQDQSPQLGFIAQEVYSTLQEYGDAVVKDNGNTLSMAYQNLIPLLTKAIQEQQAIIETQQQEIETLKNQYNDLLQRIINLENK